MVLENGSSSHTLLQRCFHREAQPAPKVTFEVLVIRFLVISNGPGQSHTCVCDAIPAICHRPQQRETPTIKAHGCPPHFGITPFWFNTLSSSHCLGDKTTPQSPTDLEAAGIVIKSNVLFPIQVLQHPALRARCARIIVDNLDRLAFTLAVPGDAMSICSVWRIGGFLPPPWRSPGRSLTLRPRHQIPPSPQHSSREPRPFGSTRRTCGMS
jgi:hypothetical protein